MTLFHEYFKDGINLQALKGKFYIMIEMMNLYTWLTAPVVLLLIQCYILLY